MSNALSEPYTSPVEVEEAPGGTAAHHCKLGKGNLLLNKHEGKEDGKLGCDVSEVEKCYICLVNPWKLAMIEELGANGYIACSEKKKRL